jgi:predicted GIY-YIG superfamily endonuclease
LVYKEEFTTRTEAMARERYFKTGIGRDEVKRILGARSPIATEIGEPAKSAIS